MTHVPSRRADISRLFESMEQLPWMDDAACRDKDPERWFPQPGQGGSRYAVKVCDSCPVTLDCLTHAARLIADGALLYGIWGGRNVGNMSRDQARLILRRGNGGGRAEQGDGNDRRPVDADGGAP